MRIDPPTALEIAALGAILPYWWAEQGETFAALSYTRDEYTEFAGMILWAFWLGQMSAR